MLSLEKRRLRADFTNIHKCLKAGCKAGRARLFPVMSSAKRKGNWHRLEHGRLHLNIRKAVCSQYPWTLLRAT